MVALLAMFPGQGSQAVGMGKDLLAEFPKAKLVFEEAEDSVQMNLRKLCLEGPATELELTANQQPCLLTLSIAIWRVLVQETGLKPLWFAGHSLGEYSALVAAGCLPLGRAAALVRKRGEAMQAAVAPGLGSMAAVLGANEDELVQRCAEESTKLKLSVEVVNFNSPQQQIISGHKQAVVSLTTKLAASGIKCLPLAVSAPFHSSLMAPAREAMTAPLQAQSLSAGSGTIIANLTGELTPDYRSEHLIKQIDSPVLWRKTMQTAEAQGADTFIEVGPGRVLTGLAKRCLAKPGKLIAATDAKAAIAELTPLTQK